MGGMVGAIVGNVNGATLIQLEQNEIDKNAVD
jgi:hypothetical protein